MSIHKKFKNVKNMAGFSQKIGLFQPIGWFQPKNDPTIKWKIGSELDFFFD